MLPYLFVLFAVAVRFLPFMGPLNVLPHAWHFTPLAASLLFFGARGSRRQMWVPLVLLAATDVVLTKFIYSSTFSLGPVWSLGPGTRQSSGLAPICARNPDRSAWSAPRSLVQFRSS